MLKICKENKQSILEKVKNGHLDTASLCSKNLIDEIILAMYTNDILSYICKSIPDKRAHNKTIPYDIIWAISIAAKMKIKTSLTDIPYAINDHLFCLDICSSNYLLCFLMENNIQVNHCPLF